MNAHMRVAWFSPFPPARSGIASYSADILPRLGPDTVVDRVDEADAHDFVWSERRNPHDLIVYQLGNAPCHDYMWAYLVRYPGLVVLHDARLHHARAGGLLRHRRADDYRREFRYNHPDVRPEAADYAVEGLGGSVHYLWPMVRVVVRTARLVAVHSPIVAADLREEFPGAAIATIRMGVPAPAVEAGARAALRRALRLPDSAIVFMAFGRVAAEKRIDALLQSLATLSAGGRDVYLLIVGEADHYAELSEQLARHGVADRVRVTGHVAEDAMAHHLAAADACLCLRWPTAKETSASWLRCLAAARATVITDLAHLSDIPASVALRVDLLDENHSLELAMRRLADDSRLREELGAAGHSYWSAGHTLGAMADDYRRVLIQAAARAIPVVDDLPSHFTDDYSGTARRIAAGFGLTVDVLRSR
jgi:glycosyltransferase involved in cell wall biosynthesis